VIVHAIQAIGIASRNKLSTCSAKSIIDICCNVNKKPGVGKVHELPRVKNVLY
jgi:hypothetical protein